MENKHKNLKICKKYNESNTINQNPKKQHYSRHIVCPNHIAFDISSCFVDALLFETDLCVSLICESVHSSNHNSVWPLQFQIQPIPLSNESTVCSTATLRDKFVIHTTLHRSICVYYNIHWWHYWLPHSMMCTRNSITVQSSYLTAAHHKSTIRMLVGFRSAMDAPIHCIYSSLHQMQFCTNGIGY